MAHKRRVLLGSRPQSDRLPDWASGGATIIEWMRQRGLWKIAADKLKIQREGGYVGIDVLQFLIYYFASELKIGIKEFSERAGPYRAQLAAVGGRQRFPTQSSTSRVLTAAEPEPVAAFGSWLLRDAPGIIEVLHHPSVLTRDAAGGEWHVLDWDPTIAALRHRALPVIEGTPDARRRSEALAAPGYSGRKRGDVQFSRAMLQHAGSGLWLGIEMGPGNGELRDAFHSAIEQTVATCEYADLPRSQVILRVDGVAGNVPFITTCLEGGVHFITRLAHYQLLEAPDIVEHLNEAEWFEVPSSGSGPTRQAADLGWIVLEPASSSVREDDKPFEPVEARVIVSRFACDGAGRGAGVVLDGWQYELYGTDLQAAAWPEAEIVSGYYGRTGLENRFLQEDRELGLDRIFSYELPGQQLASVIGLFVWNFLICRGMALAQPPRELPAQRPAESKAVVEPPRMSPEGSVEPGASAAARDEKPPATDTEPGPSVKERTTALAPATASESGTRTPVVDALDEVDWDHVLRSHTGWEWSPHQAGLCCPAGALLPFHRMEQVEGLPVRARFVATSGTCDACELRTVCIRSRDPRYRKDVRLPIPPPHGAPLLALWQEVKAGPKLRKPKKRPNSRSNKARRPIWRLKSLSWRPPGLPPERPPLAVAAPILLPAELRKISRRATRASEVHVAVELPRSCPKPSEVLAFSPARRQNRRLSWDERLRWNELPDGAGVEVRFLGNGMASLLTPTVDDAATSAKSA